MGNASSASKVSAQDKAILDLKLQRDKLHQYQRRLTPLIPQYHAIAAAHLRANDRPRALLALRRKKYHESLLSKTDAQLAQLELLTSDVEFALVQKDVVFGLKRGTEVLKDIRKEMGGLEGVEKLVGDSQEERAFQEEVANMLAEAGGLNREEEDEVEEELEGLRAKSQISQGLPEVPAGVIAEEGRRLPSTPVGRLEGKQKSRAEVREEEEQEAIPA